MAPSRAMLLAAALAVVHSALLSMVNQEVTEPYMDEPFHVPQTQRYCRGDYWTWDPKITTLPGLYVVGMLAAWLAQAYANALGWKLQPDEACGLRSLRAVNVVLATACTLVIHAILSTLAQGSRGTAKASGAKGTGRSGGAAGEAAAGTADASTAPQQQHGPRPAAEAVPEQQVLLQTLALSLFPLHWFYTFLYYTDVGSTLCILLCYLLSLRGQYAASALAGATAVLFRQTNAVWVAFVLGAAVLRLLSQLDDGYGSAAAPGGAGERTAQPSERDADRGRQGRKGAPGGTEAPAWVGGLHAELSALPGALGRHWRALAARLWPLSLVPAAFAAFVVHNGGITVGDRAAHVPVRHAPQLLYFVAFTAGMLAPYHLASDRHRALALSTLHSVLRSPLRTLLGFGAALGGCAAAVHWQTLAHPYLLADNRHYTFYIWRRLFGAHWAVKYALVPVYCFCGWSVVDSLRRRQGALWVLGLAAGLVLTLVPAWLLEFRYFTPGFLMVALHMQPPTRPQLLATIALYVAIDAATMFLFIKRPFHWPDGSVARFMW